MLGSKRCENTLSELGVRSTHRCVRGWVYEFREAHRAVPSVTPHRTKARAMSMRRSPVMVVPYTMVISHMRGIATAMPTMLTANPVNASPVP